jgi:hypothetical protein
MPEITAAQAEPTDPHGVDKLHHSAGRDLNRCTTGVDNARLTSRIWGQSRCISARCCIAAGQTIGGRVMQIKRLSLRRFTPRWTSAPGSKPLLRHAPSAFCDEPWRG